MDVVVMLVVVAREAEQNEKLGSASALLTRALKDPWLKNSTLGVLPKL